MIRRWPPFGTCPDDFAYFLGLRAAHPARAHWPMAKPKATFIVSPTFPTAGGIFGGGAWGWFDFVLPASYAAGSAITVNLTQQAVGAITAPFQFFSVAGMQLNGGSYTAAPTTFAIPPSIWCTSIGVTCFNFLIPQVPGSYPEKLFSRTPTALKTVLSFTIPGITRALQAQGIQGVPGGSIIEATPPLSPPDAQSYIRPSTFGYVGVDYWPNSWGNSGGYLYPPDAGTTPQVAAGAHPLQPGATMSIAIQAGNELNDATYCKLFKIEVVTSGGVKTNVPLSAMMKWNLSAPHPGTPVRPLAVIHSFPPFAGNDFSLYKQL